MVNRRALVTGVTGQDGSYLAKFLLEKGYSVFGTYRRLSTPNFWRLQYLDIYDKISLIPMDMDDSSSIQRTIKESKPDEVYHLAAQSFVDTSFVIPESTANFTGLGVTRLLETIKNLDVRCRFYFAASSEMYGESGTQHARLNEKSLFAPVSPYAISKLYGYWTTSMYRKAYKMFTVSGILFNHESPLRGMEFVTRKISNEVAKIHLGLSKQLTLGNIHAARDWGYAPEYVQAIWKMLQNDEPKDYVIATGESHTVAEFLSAAFNEVDFDYKDYVKITPQLQRPAEVPALTGDASLAEKDLGWKPEAKFKKIVSMMVREDIRRWSRWAEGEKFPWDAYNYNSETKILSKT